MQSADAIKDGDQRRSLTVSDREATGSKQHPPKDDVDDDGGQGVLRVAVRKDKAHTSTPFSFTRRDSDPPPHSIRATHSHHPFKHSTTFAPIIDCGRLGDSRMSLST